MVTIDLASVASNTSGLFGSLWALIHSQTLPLSLWFFISLATLHNVMTTPSSMFVARLKFTVAYGLFILAAMADLLRWVAS